MLSIRSWLPPFSVAFLGFLCFSLFVDSPAACGQQPNVLVISIDDLNDWVGCLGGHPQAKTPNIDRLARRGTLFTNAHCQAPICTPSRASMITGLLPSTTGLYFLQPKMDSSPVAKAQPDLLQTFHEAGYRTMGAGKFVFGNKEGAYYDEYGGGMGGFGPNAPEKLSGLEGNVNWDWGVYPPTDAELPDTDVATWVIDKLRASQQKPFFLVAGFWRPHVPMYAPQKWHDLFPPEDVQLPAVQQGDRDDLPAYAVDLTNGMPAPRHQWFLDEGKWKSAVRSYLASVAFVDSCVGRVLDALDASPHAENTVVVLLSDHGWQLGEKERWAKRALWTDVTRVPLIIDAPQMPDSQISDQPAGLIDLYPTLLELTGIAPSMELDGQSLVPQLTDAQATRREPVICTYGPSNHSLHYQRWHYIRYADGSEELYDLRQDPHEWHNLAGDPDQQPRLNRFRQDVPDQNADPIRISWWTRWEVADWLNAEANAEARREKTSGE